MAIEDLWYKNAILYCLDVEKYTDTPEVLALRYDFRGVSMLTLHNFANRPKTVTVDPKVRGGHVLTDVFDENHSRSENGTHGVKMPPYGPGRPGRAAGPREF